MPFTPSPQTATNPAAEQLRRQALLSNRLEPRRRALALLPFAVCTVFADPWLCLALAVINLGSEVIGLRLLNDTDPSRQRLRYWTMLTLFVISNLAFSMVAVLAWQAEDPFAKAFAIAVLMVNIVLVATVRTVHLPLALTELAASGLLTVAGNTWYWMDKGNPAGLAISSVCAVCGLYFALTTMRTVHEVHSETYLEHQTALAANAAKSRFMAQMSHELRTPLNAILGMGYAEMTYAATPEAKERLTTLVESARGLSIILDDILDLSAIEAGHLMIRPRIVDLPAEITSTLSLFHQQLSDARLDLQVDLPPDLPRFILLDRQRFRQCLSNLLSNAIKYTALGTISVEVTTAPPNLLVVQISDTGPGVAADLQARIFEPFQRGSTTVSGTGLGLSISRTLARRMGGDLTLLPSASGARFRLTVAIPPAVSPEGATLAPIPAPTPRVDLRDRRVLIVDDLATNRLVAITYLQIMGAVPQAVSCGPEALEAVAASPPDIVLLDMLMDGMDGMETFARLRALPGPAGQTPVIAMTADATDETRRACLAAGFNGYLTKPISPEHLAAAMQTIIDEQQAESDMARRI